MVMAISHSTRVGVNDVVADAEVDRLPCLLTGLLRRLVRGPNELPL
jgi:hypothetical protein